MAFKSVKKSSGDYENIESLFRDLKTDGVESLYSHQADILRSYENDAIKKGDVAIELPTGSGKTLIGLLIGEYRRRKNKERVLYLCPTVQLVNQVVELAKLKYGIKATAFTGRKDEYAAKDKALYRGNETIAVATYSSLFNYNTFFQDANIVILDDAHSAENYIASNWSLKIDREKNKSLFRAIIELLKFDIDLFTYSRLSSEDINPSEKGWVYLYDFERYNSRLNDLTDIIDPLIQGTKLIFSWLLLKDNLKACNFFFSWNEILIRPIVPPSLTNSTFADAKQRLFMSATLGKAGDLERITGIRNIFKIPVPSGWDKQGLGRRYFNFPNLSLEDDEVLDLVSELAKVASRTVALVSSTNDGKSFKNQLETKLDGFTFLTADDIEESKGSFTESENAIVVLANRFDGLDFPGEDSKLLIVKDIPYAANLQEKFIQSRINASVLFYDRNRTRLIQAIGRCTRSPKDYSAVYVIGEGGLSDWLVLPEKHKYLHPELQAEIEFGIADSSVESFIENFKHFKEQDSYWTDANNEIINLRSQKNKENIPGEDELNEAVEHEVDYQYHLWKGNYLLALTSASKVLQKIEGGSELGGYRALWHYFSALAAFHLYNETNEMQYEDLKIKNLERAVNISSSFRQTLKFSGSTSTSEKIDSHFDNNIARLAGYLEEYKIVNTKKIYKEAF